LILIYTSCSIRMCSSRRNAPTWAPGHPRGKRFPAAGGHGGVSNSGWGSTCGKREPGAGGTGKSVLGAALMRSVAGDTFPAPAKPPHRDDISAAGPKTAGQPALSLDAEGTQRTAALGLPAPRAGGGRAPSLITGGGIRRNFALQTSSTLHEGPGYPSWGTDLLHPRSRNFAPRTPEKALSGPRPIDAHVGQDRTRSSFLTAVGPALLATPTNRAPCPIMVRLPVLTTCRGAPQRPPLRSPPTGNDV